MRQWLGRAGIVRTSDWRIDEGKLEKVLGASNETLDQLAALSPQQKAFLKTVVNLGTPGPHLSNEVERLATTTYGVRFNEKALPRQVLYPLRDAGYITLERHGGEKSHGAKPFAVTLTDKTQAELIGPLLDALDQQVGAELRPLLRKTIAQILQDVKSEDRYVKGLALEALALHIMRLVDLQYVAKAHNAIAPAKTAIDLIFRSRRLLLQRWQVTCFDGDRPATPDDLARAVGVTFLTKCRVVLFLTMQETDDEAEAYVRTIAEDTAVRLVVLGPEEIQEISSSPTRVGRAIFRRTPDILVHGACPSPVISPSRRNGICMECQ